MNSLLLTANYQLFCSTLEDVRPPTRKHCSNQPKICLILPPQLPAVAAISPFNADMVE